MNDKLVERQLLLMDLQKELKRPEYDRFHLLFLGFLRTEVEKEIKKLEGEKI